MGLLSTHEGGDAPWSDTGHRQGDGGPGSITEGVQLLHLDGARTSDSST